MDSVWIVYDECMKTPYEKVISRAFKETAILALKTFRQRYAPAVTSSTKRTRFATVVCGTSIRL